jgi:hypothetical protein
VEGGAAVGFGTGLAAYSVAGGIVAGAGLNPTRAAVGGVNAYSWGSNYAVVFPMAGNSFGDGRQPSNLPAFDECCSDRGYSEATISSQYP